MIKKKTTTVVPDYSQLQKTNDVVKCKQCHANYAVSVAVDLKHVLTKCPWCERVQEYNSDLLFN